MVYVAYVSVDPIRSSNMSLWTQLAIEDDGVVCTSTCKLHVDMRAARISVKFN